MKYTSLTVIALFAFLAVNAQSVESTAEYNKAVKPAVICEFPYPPALVEGVLFDDLKQKGFGKGKSSKGFDVYQAINFNEISADKIDLYVKVERKGRKDKGVAVITVLLSKGYDNFVSGASDASMVQNAMNYLNGLKPKLEKTSLEIQIAEQEEVLKKTEKKMNDLVDDGSSLEKKKKKIEEEIEENKKEQEKQKTEVEKQKQILDSIKAQRKN